jgi:PAS domain S-box-containing protein
MTGQPAARSPDLIGSVPESYTRANHAWGHLGVGGMVAVTALAVLAIAAVAALVATGWNDGPAKADAWLRPVLLLCAIGPAGAAVLIWHCGRVFAARHRQAAERAHAAETQLRTTHERLIEAVNAIPVGFALYDNEERLVLFNQTYNRMIGHIGGLDETMIGRTYEEVLTRLEAQMRVKFPDRDLSNWKSQYLRRFRQREGLDLLWEVGQTVRLRQIETPSGGTILIRVDVTDLKRSEEEARAAQKRFDLLANSLSDAVFSTDRDGRFNYISGAMANILGYAPQELIGRRPGATVHPDDRARLEECVKTMRERRGVPVAFPHRGLHKDGRIRHVEVRMTAPDKADNLEGELAVTGVMRDMQAEHEMAERLNYELQRLNSVVQSSGAAIVLVDRDLRIIMANNGFISATPERQVQSVIGRALGDFVKEPIDPAVVDAWFAAGPSDPVQALEYETSSSDAQGRKRFYHVTANPVRDDGGAVQHIVFLSVDHTAQREAEMQLFDSSRLATVGEMASGVAHEINQPLAIIRFAAESLQEQLQDTPREAPLAEATGLIDAKLTRIVTQTERAAAIIQELKGFSRRPGDAPRPFDVPDTVRAAAHMLCEQLRLSRIEEELDFDAGCPPVLGHAGRLQQVIINLMINARDAIQERAAAAGPDSPVGMIRLRVRHVPATGKIIATVEDNGPGIPDSVLPRLFEPFFTTKPTGKGTGLGLSVSYQIIRQMGGTIAAENRAEGGARFTITLNAVPAHAAAA